MSSTLTRRAKTNSGRASSELEDLLEREVLPAPRVALPPQQQRTDSLSLGTDARALNFSKTTGFGKNSVLHFRLFQCNFLRKMPLNVQNFQNKNKKN